jgi:nitrate reductase delta subunit
VTGRRRGAARELPDEQVVWQAASVLLAYPEDQDPGALRVLRAASESLPGRLGDPLKRFLDDADRTPVLERAARYVQTFDHQRRCCLYLTYYAHGDTRKRGMALLEFKNAYRAAGLELGADELPDHLAVVLEFAASVDPGAGRKLLVDHRAGIELLRLALEDSSSPYADVLRAVTATLPPLRGDEREAVVRLAAEGPPAEEVGLQPFAPPEYMPTGAAR